MTIESVTCNRVALELEKSAFAIHPTILLTTTCGNWLVRIMVWYGWCVPTMYECGTRSTTLSGISESNAKHEENRGQKQNSQRYNVQSGLFCFSFIPFTQTVGPQWLQVLMPELLLLFYSPRFGKVKISVNKMKNEETQMETKICNSLRNFRRFFVLYQRNQMLNRHNRRDYIAIARARCK